MPNIKHKINSLALEQIRSILLQRGYYSMDNEAQISFSQMGEDRILQMIFPNKNNGFYVDVGAYHPKRYSNTYLFYLKGWQGINIDTTPGSMKLFNTLRPRDINLEIAIASKATEVRYNLFNEPALNTFSKDMLKRNSTLDHKVIETKNMQTQTLHQVFGKHLPKKQRIDFLSIDVEGLDYDVLISNNWEKFRPQVVLIEDVNFSLEKPQNSKIYTFLRKKRYALLSLAYHTLIFTSTI